MVAVHRLIAAHRCCGGGCELRRFTSPSAAIGGSAPPRLGVARGLRDRRGRGEPGSDGRHRRGVGRGCRRGQARPRSGQRDLELLRAALQSLGYSEDQRALDAFKTRLAEYRTLEDEILPLAVENTNLKAQRLSFGPSQEAAQAFSAAVEAAARGAKGGCGGDALGQRARAALLEIQVLQAPHIAEADDAAMTRIEARMKDLARAARTALDDLKAPDAVAAFDRFITINDEIIALSRRNSNVRSLALSLGRKRMVTAECEDDLRALEQALAKHEFSATR